MIRLAVAAALGLSVASCGVFGPKGNDTGGIIAWSCESEPAARAIAAGEDIGAVLSAARAAVLKAGFRQVDYIEARNAETFAPLAVRGESGRVLAAAFLGKARLIDNVPVPKP